jgi:tetratricopeptide (TPR) repeat protein
LAAALRAHVELQRSTAMKMKGEYEAALELLIRSERHFSEAAVCRTEIGTVRWAQAIILFKMERLTEAAQVAQKARHVSEEAGDWRGVSRARIIAGCIAAERGEIASAKRTFLELLRSTPRTDRITVARLSLNLATCDLRAGALGTAREQLMRATELFASLGLMTEVVRAHWLDAKITAAEGDVRRALQKFRQAMREFEKLKMPLDAGFSGLDLLELLLATGRQRAEAERLARRLVTTFVAAGTRASAANALTYLREAVAGRDADAVLVHYVSTYVRRSSVYADEPFLPPEAAAEPPTG